MEHLFVYGTLMKRAHHPARAILDKKGRLLGSARCPGRLYDLGEYPGMTPPKESGEEVLGELYEVDDPESTLSSLDLYEGYDARNYLRSEFIRETVIVHLTDGSEKLAWVYYYNARVEESCRIAGGSYLDPAEPQETKQEGETGEELL